MPNSIVNVLTLKGYIQSIRKTDKLPRDDISPILNGLFGEVGSVLSATKKQVRENLEGRYWRSLLEEFGDTFWYFAVLCLRLDVDILKLFEVPYPESNNRSRNPLEQRAASHQSPRSVKSNRGSTQSLIQLGAIAGELLNPDHSSEKRMGLLRDFALTYVSSVEELGVEFEGILEFNANKTRGRFLKPKSSDLGLFDDAFPCEERIPMHFRIEILERQSGMCQIRWNNVFIGQRITDNSYDPDGYRYHDVFHFANAAVLGWSPVFRALIQQKRKSDPSIDEVEDGGRAIAIEEGLTAWIFSCAKELDFFEGTSRLSFDLLKTVQQFVKGLEVEEIPLRQWEKAIVQGYKVFRKIRKNKGGIVVGDLESRTIRFKRMRAP